MPKALVAMSGGVDSVAAVILMKQKGYDVCGVTMLLCPEDSDVSDARTAANELGIDFFVLDCRSEFKEKVMDPFINSYCLGETPNPCICCNKELKFGLLISEAKRRGFDVLATGHYACISRDEKNSEPILEKAKDLRKDQSYVLYSVNAEYLKDIRFPLGEISKEEARELVKNSGIHLYKKAESQDICFVKDGDYAGFIATNRENADKPGDFVNITGKILGKHKGLTHYTVGQRRGLGVSGESSYYVLKKDIENNRIILGFENELKTNTFSVKDINILSPSMFTDGVRCKVRTRYHQSETDCTVCFEGERVRIVTDSDIRIPAPGQSAVFYCGDRVIAGGIII